MKINTGQVAILLLTGIFVLSASVSSIDAQKKSGKASEEKPEGGYRYVPKSTLYRFQVIEEKEEKFEEWMKFLADNRVAVIETLDREKMYFESVFTEKIDDRLFVYWLVFKAEGGKSVESSPLEIDKKHLEYWNECIKKGSRTTFETRFYLTPPFIEKAVVKHQKSKRGQ